jgi:hypothetical protein
LQESDQNNRGRNSKNAKAEAEADIEAIPWIWG